MSDILSKEFLNELSNLTNENNHTESYILIADKFNLLKLSKVFNIIKAIQEVEGEIPDGVYEYRNDCLKKMLESIMEYHGLDVWQKITGCI